MISLLSLKLPQTLCRVVLFVAAVVAFLVFLTMNTNDSIVSASSSLRTVLSKFNTSIYYDPSYGYKIAPGAVSFSFVPKRGTKDSPKDVLKENTALYESVMAQEIGEPKDFDIDSIRPPENVTTYQRENATIVALVRNNEIKKIQRTITQFEEKFNKKFGYPYTFINDEPFTERFIEKVRGFTSAPVSFVHLDPQAWNKPEWIDTEREWREMNLLANQNVAYAKKGSYHNMCRFYSGPFFDVPEMRKYRYYWRIEPNVKFFTDVNYDVFKYLAGTGKIYGFTISVYDIHQTVRTLFPETLKFLNKGDNYKYVNENGAFQWITENKQLPEKAIYTGGYSTCHFWSNFEMGDMNFFRDEAYSSWFNHLDATGNFYYERWGDAPVHSLGLALFADKRKIHWFRDIGYYHDPYMHCPNTPSRKGCDVGHFGPNEQSLSQNCMATWIRYEIDDLSSIY
ncbi:putative mannosyltransferase [Clavispora lusitaniae]|uniref:Mannosyltransferase n=1 Tax=Clavispora lusitaniae TaxID=36911 RepID=A0ACD0WI75_CLALS|nr:putative mannosyltransferase [Clavispora lusitaniae]QFZ33530.1 putative mannosyltransferase [Clavispora lusitaniae]QFZ39201.1 putative mannosyltransferase [Clavispora lusitaniae]QFZ44883.1 putative mannosyltransferase [Clavispora lusitaniae]QFZ50560.1 putative mannosyltransferase [Clavispora lusitaniae]